MTTTSTTQPPFEPPERKLGQTIIWTALPQGRVAGSPGKVRVAAFVSPQLGFTETIGYRTENSTELSSFPDWVNWPETLANPDNPVTFQVCFSTLGHSVFVDATCDLSVLKPAYWAAMFGAEKTRVDSYGFQNFAKPTTTTFSAIDAHSTIVGTYNDFAGSSATVNAQAASNPSSYTNPANLSLHLLGEPSQLKTLSGLHAAVSALRASGVPANLAAANVLSPPTPVQDALSFHAAPANNTALSAPTVPILDFHSAISSLGHFPELLRYFGLLIPLEVEVPSNIGPTTSFNVAVIANWTSAGGVPTVNVPLATHSTLANGTFLSAPDPSESLYSNGALNLGDPTFSIVDVDVDRAAHSLNSLALNLASTQALHAPAAGSTTPQPETALSYALPALRGAGLSLIWSGFGAQGQGLNALATRQANLNTNISNWISTHPFVRPVSPDHVLYTEDITRGWRVDVLDESNGDKTWRSLHWREATYAFGPDGPDQVTLAEAMPIEGMVTPAVSHSEAPGTVPSQMFVHEMITRWVGWSLSSPRPGGQVNDDGSVSATAVGNPAVSTTYVDAYGNYNPQISATFMTPRGALAVTDPVTDQPIGTTGLPTLRFGHTYRLAARAVDLGGWSINQGRGIESQPLTHSRWEPVKAPIVLPIAPLTSGEGVFTVVIREDGVTPPEPNARWLFPPRVHELLAEEHGAFDANGVPAKSLYQTIVEYSDGSIETLVGAVNEGSVGSPNIILPTALPSTITTATVVKRPKITWIADPASFGYALFFEPPPGVGQSGAAEIAASAFTGSLPFTEFNSDIAGIPSPSPVFTDKWADEGEAWPVLAGKLLMLIPVPLSEEQFRILPSGVVVPQIVTATKSTDSPDLLGLAVVPGSVYQVRLSSIFPYEYATSVKTGNILGLLPKVLASIQGTSAVNALHHYDAILEGQIPQLTPYHTLQFVYAVLVPQIAPKFSADVTFTRLPGGITVAINDPTYHVDIPTTQTVTYSATWTDPLDNPADPTNDPATATTKVTQSSLVLGVKNIYTNPIAPDPMVPIPTTSTGTQPFGTIDPDNAATGTLSATHRIGDTKHHYVTYTPIATSRFGNFFSKTASITLDGTTPAVLDDRGIDANLVTVRVASSGALVAAGEYGLDASTGSIALIRQKYVELGHPNPFYSGVPLTVTYVPTDTRAGAPYKVHIPSTTAPPPIKVVKVSPAWSLSTSGTPGNSDYRYNRTGNTLRVYFDRPWYVTGANEMVGVLSAYFRDSDQGTAKVVGTVSIDDVTLFALDPINVASLGSYSQTQLNFVSPTAVPSVDGKLTGTFSVAGGNPVRVPSPLDPAAENYNIWGFEPQYDPVTGYWYADIQLAMTGFTDRPPPGYFLRLALARFQPYSIGQKNAAHPTDNRFLSTTTLVTIAQPVTDRQVTVVSEGESTLDVTVSGPGYFGWRPAPDNPTNPWVHDVYNEYALHPHSDHKGAQSTSTMVVEIQKYDDSNGFSGDFGWSTIENLTVVLEPKFDDPPLVTWKTGSTPIRLPAKTAVSTLRLRISELDYYQTANGAPVKVDTNYRRSFVAHIPL